MTKQQLKALTALRDVMQEFDIVFACGIDKNGYGSTDVNVANYPIISDYLSVDCDQLTELIQENDSEK